MEDLVTDGLITLYMEDHNVEEYLRTARESTEVRRSIIVPGLETIPENHMDENLENRDMPPPLPPRYVCMHVCMYVCVYVYMYVCMYVCMYICMYVYMYVYMYVCVYVYMYV